jgi:hypothetical protein
MLEWLHDQVYHFNFFTAGVTIFATTVLAKTNLTKEVRMLTDDFYKNVEEVKDTIRDSNK